MHNPFKKKRVSKDDKFNLNKLHDPLNKSDVAESFSKYDPMKKGGEQNSFGDLNDFSNQNFNSPSSFQDKQSFSQQPSIGHPSQTTSRDFELVSSKLDNIKLMLESLTNKIVDIDKRILNLEKKQEEDESEKEKAKEKYAW